MKSSDILACLPVDTTSLMARRSPLNHLLSPIWTLQMYRLPLPTVAVRSWWRPPSLPSAVRVRISYLQRQLRSANACHKLQACDTPSKERPRLFVPATCRQRIPGTSYFIPAQPVERSGKVSMILPALMHKLLDLCERYMLSERRW